MRDGDLTPRSTEQRYREVYAKFRQYHVDIQRLWKRMPALVAGAYVSAAFPATVFGEPFEIPSGGTAVTGTPCKNRYCVSRYSDDVSQVSGGGTVLWTTVTRAEDAPDNLAAIVQAPASGSHQSYYLSAEDFGFTIPEDAILVSLRTFAVMKYTAGSDSTFPGFGGFSRYHLNGTGLVGASFGGTLMNSESFLEHAGNKILSPGIAAGGLTPDIINSENFGVQFNATIKTSQKVHVDAIRIEVCYDLYTLSGTCSENHG